MKFRRNEYGPIVEIFGRKVHVGNQELVFARNLILAIETLSGKWTIAVQDYNCETHQILLKVDPMGFYNLKFTYMDKYLGSLNREEVLQICKDRLEAEYWGMYV